MPVEQSPQKFNFATQSNWFLTIPHSKLFEGVMEKDFNLNLYNYSIPPIYLNTQNLGAFANPMPVYSGGRIDSKKLAFNYLMSEDWSQYHFLYRWMNKISNECNNGQDAPEAHYMIDISVTILSAYKTPMFKIHYHNAWISGLGGIDLNYQGTGGEPVNAMFELSFSHYTTESILPDGENCSC